MKKLLFIIQQLDCGGVEKALINLLNLVDKEQYDCEVFVIKKKGNFIQFLPEWLKVREYDCPSYIKDMVSYFKQPKIKKGDNCWTVIDKIFWNIIFFINRVYVKLFEKNIMYGVVFNRYKKRNNIDNYNALIDFHGYGTFTTYLPAMTKTSAKKVSWIHEQNIYRAYRCISHTYKKFDHIFGCSLDCCKNFLETFPNTKEYVSVYYNYLDVEEIFKKAKCEISISKKDREKFKIVSAGRISEQKAFNRAVDATAILKEKGLKFVWYVLGNGEDLETLRERVKKEDLEEYINFVGFCENPYSYMNMADLYVQTSIAEGFCTTISEAIVLGKPVVTTDVSGAREQLGDGQGGIIVNHSVDEIAEAIEILINDKDKLLEMSTHNKKKNMDYKQEICKLYEIIG